MNLPGPEPPEPPARSPPASSAEPNEQSSQSTYPPDDDSHFLAGAVYQDIDAMPYAADPGSAITSGSEGPNGAAGGGSIAESRLHRVSESMARGPGSVPEEADEDLLDIIQDLRGSSFSLGDMEQLVESWRRRNDAHQSFTDRQVGVRRGGRAAAERRAG